MAPEAEPADPVRTERWNRLKELFTAASELPPTERNAFVEQACGDDAALLTELRGLLGSAEIDDGFIEVPAAEAMGWADERNERDLVGQQIGPYRIVGLAGRGGLSDVYRAVREGSGYEQQVAIKLLRSGFDGEALLRRFNAERRMLAALAHPNIAHFMDGGATNEGTPYLVMEFVEGRPLDEYCDANALSLEARLDLFRVLCGAVQYVHQHLMVHGDLKGGNVLVTPGGVVKLLDFGLAKLLTPDDPIGDSTRPATLMLLTPDYASPEQLRGEAITTASDVYSLGTLLYRLLTGTTPYGTDHAPPVVLNERMAAGGPTLPDVAAERTGGANASFVRELRGDLGTIVLKAIKVDPAERYASAQQLADDLQRWLRGFPVEARPDSVGYRLRKWSHRHRATAVLSALAVVALVGGIAATSWQAHLARVERERAERNFNAVRELSSVFLADVYQAVAKIPGSTEARKLLVNNTLKYLQALERDARDSPELQRDLGTAYERLGDVQGGMNLASLGDQAAATASYRRSLAIRKQLALESPTLVHRGESLRAQLNLTENLLASGDVAGAQALAPDMLRLAEEIDADPAAGRTELRYVGAAFANRGWAEWSGGHADSGLASLDRAREVYRRIARAHPEDRLAQRDLALVAGRLGEVHAKGTGQLDVALRYYQEAVALFDTLLRDDPQNTDLITSKMYAQATVGDLLNQLGRPRDALLQLEAILPGFRSARSADPSNQMAPIMLAAALVLLGESRLQLGEYGPAQITFVEAASLMDPKITASVPDVQVVDGTVHAGLARAHFGLAGAAATQRQRDASRLQAEYEGKRALAMLEPHIKSPQTAKDAQRQINQLRAAFGWSD